MEGSRARLSITHGPGAGGGGSATHKDGGAVAEDKKGLKDGDEALSSPA